MKREIFATASFITLFLHLIAQDSFAVQWAKTFGGDNPQYLLSYSETNDSGYILAGYIGDSTSIVNAGFVMKVDRNGIVAWQKIYEGADNEREMDFLESGHAGVGNVRFVCFRCFADRPARIHRRHRRYLRRHPAHRAEDCPFGL